MLADYEWERLPNTVRRPALTGFFSSSTPAVRAVLARDRPDAVIITGWNARPLLQALRACSALGIPRIVRGESNALRARPPAGSAWCIARSFPDLTRTSPSAGRIAIFISAYGVDPARIFSCRYFVDNRRIRGQFESEIPNRAALRADWGIPEASFCFLYVGKLEPKKRIVDLLHALRDGVAHQERSAPARRGRRGTGARGQGSGGGRRPSGFVCRIPQPDQD